MTQERLASRLYISRSYLSHIERLECIMGEELAERLVAYFDQNGPSNQYVQGIRDTLDKAIEEVQALRTYEAVLSIKHARRLFDDYLRTTS